MNRILNIVIALVVLLHCSACVLEDTLTIDEIETLKDCSKREQLRVHLQNLEGLHQKYDAMNAKKNEEAVKHLRATIEKLTLCISENLSKESGLSYVKCLRYIEIHLDLPIDILRSEALKTVSNTKGKNGIKF